MKIIRLLVIITPMIMLGTSSLSGQPHHTPESFPQRDTQRFNPVSPSERINWNNEWVKRYKEVPPLGAQKQQTEPQKTMAPEKRTEPSKPAPE